MAESHSGDLVAPIKQSTVSEQQIGKQVQERLKKVEQLEEAIAELRDHLDEANDRAGKFEQKANNLSKLVDRKETLDAREAELEAREQKFFMDQELSEEKMLRRNAEERISDHQRMMELVFRNTQLRKTGTVPMTRNYGGTVTSNGYDKPDVPLEGAEEIVDCETIETEEEC